MVRQVENESGHSPCGPGLTGDETGQSRNVELPLPLQPQPWPKPLPPPVPHRSARTPLQPLPEEPVLAHVCADSVPLPGSAPGGRGCAGLSG